MGNGYVNVNEPPCLRFFASRCTVVVSSLKILNFRIKINTVAGICNRGVHLGWMGVVKLGIFLEKTKSGQT